MAIKQLPTTVYDKMTFPDYEFIEFPTAIPLVDGVPCFDPEVLKAPYDRSLKPQRAYPVVMVASQAELDALKAGAEVVAVNPDAVGSASRVKTEEDEREALYVTAEQVGAKIDKRWSVERIETAIAAARNTVL